MLDLKTVFLFSATINLFIAAAATAGWFKRTGERDMKYWCLASWFMMAGGVIMGAGDAMPAYSAGYLGGMVYVSSMGFLRVGLKEFYGKPVRLHEILAVAAAVGLGIFLSRMLSGGTADGIWLLYLGSAVNLAGAAAVARQARPGEALPSRRLSTGILSVYAAGNLIVAPFTVIDPVRFVDGVPQAAWLEITSIPLVLCNMAAYLIVLVLKLERATENQRLLATRDALTGALNRRAFFKELEKRADSSGTLAIIDLDHFKRINDRHGHQAGDEVLRQFVERVMGSLPSNAVFGRLGGEEFGLCLPGLAESAAASLLEELRRDVEKSSIRVTAGEAVAISITFSCGYAGLEAGLWRIDLKMVEADCALHAAKDAGRNCIVAYGPEHGFKRLEAMAARQRDKVREIFSYMK